MGRIKEKGSQLHFLKCTADKTGSVCALDLRFKQSYRKLNFSSPLRCLMKAVYLEYTTSWTRLTQPLFFLLTNI